MDSLCHLGTIVPTAVAGLGGMGISLLSRQDERKPAIVAVLLSLVALAFLFLGQDYYSISDSTNGVGAKFLGNGFLRDPLTWFFSVFVLIGTLCVVLASYGRLESLGIDAYSEFYGLLLMTSAGAIVLAGSGEMITMFVGLEALSLGLYCLCGSAITSKRGVEGALKYFILGSFSSAFLLYGMALIYGVTGTTDLILVAGELQAAEVMSERVVAAAGIGMVLIGVFFKLGAVPFHFWAPDVYQGAPTPVTVYMATVVKAVAVSMALRLLWGAFGSEVVAGWWVGFVWTVAVLTMVVGNLVAVRQRNVKRMLAYSSIAHVGYIAAGLLTSTEQYGGGAAILFYLIVYSIATIGALTLVMVVTGDRVNEPDADDLALFSGLNTRHPWLAAAMTLFLLSLAGLPPGVAGLIGKLFLFSSIVKGEFLGLAVIGGLCSAISCYYYLRVVMEMYVKPPSENVASGSYPRRAGANLIILVMTILSLAIGLFPGRIYDRGQIVLNSVFGD